MTAILRFDYHEFQPIVIDGIPWIKEWEIAECISIDRRELKTVFKRNRDRFDPEGTRLIQVFTVLGPMLVRVYTAESASLLASFYIGGKADAFSKWISEAMPKSTTPPPEVQAETQAENQASTRAEAQPHDFASVVIPDGVYNHTAEERLHRGLSALSALVGLLESTPTYRPRLDDVAAKQVSSLLELIHAELVAVQSAMHAR